MTLPTNSHRVASPGLATATAEAAGDTTAALARLRQRLRGALGTQLPTQVQAGQQRTGAVVGSPEGPHVGPAKMELNGRGPHWPGRSWMKRCAATAKWS